MCHPKFEWMEPEERQEPPPTPVAQYVEYNQWQWQLYNELFHEVYSLGIYGAYYQFLIHELEGGPYWSNIKTQLGQPQVEYDPEASVSGSRQPLTPDSDSTASDSTEDSSDTDSDSEWIHLSDIVSTQQDPESENNGA